MKPISLLLGAVFALTCAGEDALPAAPGDLHSQSSAAVLQQKFSSPDISYLLLDSRGTVVAQRWQNAEREVPIGSLIKPFIALSYGRTHDTFPSFRCTGRRTCWLPKGHGNIQLREAIAFSCNSYFHQLYTLAEPRFAGPLLADFGLSSETDGYSGSGSPLALARAYLRLVRDPQDKTAAVVLQGMALSAQVGTGKAAGAALPRRSALVKTGTANCTHSRSVPGDGFAVLILPSDRLETVLLVRVHGRPGSFAAGIAGRMMAVIENSGVAQ